MSVQAEIITDGSVGLAKSLSGPNFIITQGLGTLKGDNLFHSFQEFNVGTNESATFTGGNTIQNVITRVTGGNLSKINGTVSSTVGGASFYFINPAGVVFGSNATIDVPSDFYVSTAHDLRFDDASLFSAIEPDASSLSIEKPQSFGFLGGQDAQVVIFRSNLDFQPSSDVFFSAGDISMESGNINNVSGGIELYADNISLSGSLIDVSGNGAGNVLINSDKLQVSFSRIVADNIGEISATDTQAIILNSNTLNINSSEIRADALDSGLAASIKVIAGNLILNGSSISSDTGINSSGDSGNIVVNIDENLTITAGAIFSNTGLMSSGSAGSIKILAKDINLNDKGKISSNTFSDGNAGNIDVQAHRIEIGGNSIDNSQEGNVIEIYEKLTGIISASSAKGDASNIQIVAQDINISKGGKIFSITLADGNAGNIDLQAEQIDIEGNGVIDVVLEGENKDLALLSKFSSLTGVASASAVSTSAGHGGNINIVSKSISVTNAGAIFSGTNGTGNGGNIQIKADDLLIDGNNANTPTAISSATFAKGNAGFVEVSAEKLSISNGGHIATDTNSEGHAGSVKVSSGQLVIDGGDGEFFITGIFSDANSFSSGNAGMVDVDVDGSLSIVQGGVIQSSTLSKGDAGSVTVKAREILMDSQGNDFRSTGIFSRADFNSLGQAGSISIYADQLVMNNNSEVSIESRPVILNDSYLKNIQPTLISVNAQTIKLDSHASINAGSLGNVPASSIDVNFSNALVLDNATLTTLSNNSDGGNISVNGGEMVLYDGLVTTSVLGQGDGGDIILNPEILILDGGFIQANTEGKATKGGEITVGSSFLLSNKKQLEVGGGDALKFTSRANVIQAAAPGGVSGTITILTPEIDISSDITSLNSNLLDLELIKSPCDNDVSSSSLVNKGKDGVLLTPENDIYIPFISNIEPELKINRKIELTKDKIAKLPLNIRKIPCSM